MNGNLHNQKIAQRAWRLRPRRERPATEEQVSDLRRLIRFFQLDEETLLLTHRYKVKRLEEITVCQAGSLIYCIYEEAQNAKEMESVA